MEHFLVLIGFESNRIVYAEVQISAKQCGLPIGNLARHWVSPSATKDNTYHRGRPRGYIRRRRMVTKGGRVAVELFMRKSFSKTNQFVAGY